MNTLRYSLNGQDGRNSKRVKSCSSQVYLRSGSGYKNAMSKVLSQPLFPPLCIERQFQSPLEYQTPSLNHSVSLTDLVCTSLILYSCS